MVTSEALAARIQALPPAVRWVHAQPDVILATTYGIPLYRGPLTRQADRLIDWSGVIGAERLVAAIASVALLLSTYLKQYLTRQAAKPDGPLFVGIGALREPSLVTELEARYGKPAALVDEMNEVTFFRYQRVSFWPLLREWVSVWREIWPKFSPLQPAIGLERRYCLTQLLLRSHKYIYGRAWFRQHLAHSRSPVIALSALSHVAFAAASAGGKAIYLMHGFQCRSLVYPDLSEVYCFNRFEAEHAQSRLPQARVEIIREPMRPIKTEYLAAIASDYWPEQDFDLCRSFIQWARQRQLPVVIRQHPAYRAPYWEQWRGVEGVELLDGDGDFESFLRQRRPRVLATWFSTTLFDALVNGVVPVTLTREGPYANGEIVFPFREISLQWPDQKSELERMIDDPAACARFSAEKYLSATGQSADADDAFADRSAVGDR